MAHVPTASSLGLGTGPGKVVPLQGRLNVQSSPADFGAQQAQVIGGFAQDLGQAGGQLYRAQQAVEERDARVSATKFGLDARLELTKWLGAAKQSAAPGAEGFVDTVMKHLDEFKTEHLKEVKPGLYRSLVEDDLDRFQISAYEHATDFQSQAKRAKADTDQKASLGLAGSILATDPGQFAELLARQLKDVEASGMPASWKEETARVTTAALTNSMIQGLIEQEPRGTLALLESTPMPGLEGPDQQQLLDRARVKVNALDNQEDRARREGMAEGQQALNERVENADAMFRDGQDPGVLPTLADVEAVFPATQVPRVWAKVQDKIRLGRAVGSVAGKSFAEQDAILAGMTPDAAAPNFADQVAMRDATATAINQERSALRQDPAAYTQRHNPAVARAFAEAGQDPSKAARAIRMSLAEQERIGVAPDKVAPLPKETAGSVVDQFKAAQTSDARLALLAPYTLKLQDDTVGRKILDQLEEAGLPPATALALERFHEGDIGAAREILGYVTADPKDAPKLGDATAKDVQSEVDDKFAGPGYIYDATAAGVAAKAASLVPDPELQRSLELQRTTMLRLAQSYAAAGADPAAAANRAYKVVYGNKQVIVDDDLGAVTVPQGVESSDLEAGLENIRRVVDLSGLTPRREQYPNDAAWELALRDHDQRVQDLREDGQWIDGPDGGFYLVDPLLGSAVKGADGKARVFSIEEVTGQARAPADLSGLSLTGSPGNPWAMAQPTAAPDKDRLFAAVEQRESGGQNVVANDPDRAPEDRAAGPMQVMPGTARDTAAAMGITDLQGLDNKATQAWMLAHPDQARAIGRHYLDEQLAKYDGNVALAIAAYHAGPATVDKWIARYGDPRQGRITDREWAARIPGPKTRGYTLDVLGALA